MKIDLKSIKFGLVGLISALLIGTTGVIYMTSAQLSNAYICTTSLNVGIFERVSATNKTGYWTANGTTLSKTCTNGYWMRLADYAKTHDIIIKIDEEANRRYICDIRNCTKVI